MYRVKEAFYTLQGEGAQAGRAAVFCRFSKCNLWTGREKDRARAICNFCDTDFVGTDGQNGGAFDTAEGLALHIRRLWPDEPGQPYVVCTGGEPLLQLDEPLIEAFHEQGFEVGVETNGTLPAPAGVDCAFPLADPLIRLPSDYCGDLAGPAPLSVQLSCPKCLQHSLPHAAAFSKALPPPLAQPDLGVRTPCQHCNKKVPLYAWLCPCGEL